MIEFFTSSYLGAVLDMFIGVLMFGYSLKKGDTAPSSPLQPYLSGIVGGIIFFIVGVIVLINKLLGNW